MTAFFASVARDAGARVVYLPDAGLTAIVWTNQGELVTAGNESGVDSSTVVAAPGGRKLTARRRPAEAPVGALQITDASAVKSLPAVRQAMTAGASWVLQVARRRDGSLFFTPGLHGLPGDRYQHRIDRGDGRRRLV